MVNAHKVELDDAGYPLYIEHRECTYDPGSTGVFAIFLTELQNDDWQKNGYTYAEATCQLCGNEGSFLIRQSSTPKE